MGERKLRRSLTSSLTYVLLLDIPRICHIAFFPVFRSLAPSCVPLAFLGCHCQILQFFSHDAGLEKLLYRIIKRDLGENQRHDGVPYSPQQDIRGIPPIFGYIRMQHDPIAREECRQTAQNDIRELSAVADVQTRRCRFVDGRNRDGVGK